MKKILGILILTVICCINLTADLNDGLVAYYPFNGNADDESGNGNNGTVNGATLTTDRFGNENCAYNFDGVNDYIQTNSVLFDGELSFSGWIKTNQSGGFTTGGNGVIFSTAYYHGGYGKGIALAHGNNSLSFSKFPETSGWSLTYIGCESDSINNNKWKHVICLWDGTVNNNTVKMYLNGNIVKDTTAISTILEHDFNFRIGHSNDGYIQYYHKGDIDDIRIYNRVLSITEIDLLYHEGGWGFQANFTSPETSYIGEEFQFTDTSSGNPTTWEWDFENDGIYDSTYYSFQDTIYWSYENTNVDSVKLRISKGTLMDSLTKAITVSYCPPASPQNINVEIVQPDAIISWTEVDTTICGSTITPDGYVVKYSENEEDYFYLWFTPETNFTHSFVTEYSPQMFYEVITIKNYNREQIEYLESLNNSREKLKWSEVKRNLEVAK